jgi:hypothetical protein
MGQVAPRKPEGIATTVGTKARAMSAKPTQISMNRMPR